jgi:hypothetical protein
MDKRYHFVSGIKVAVLTGSPSLARCPLMQTIGWLPSIQEAYLGCAKDAKKNA